MIKDLLTSLLTMSVCLTGISQVNDSTSKQQTSDTIFFNLDHSYDDVFIATDTEAQFPGGKDSLYAFVKDHLKYPGSHVR